MRCAFAVILSMLVMSYQCYTDEDLAEALWNDANNSFRRSEMSDICRFLLRNGNSDIDPATLDRMNMNVYKSLYALLAYINEPALEEALIKRMETRCRMQLQQEAVAGLNGIDEAVYKRSENEKVVGKKVKFHSWGGKRTSETGNEGVIPNPVYRAKFHSWGGKRSAPGSAPGEAI